MCGRVMKAGGWFGVQGRRVALEMSRGSVVPLECSNDHVYEVEGRWLLDEISKANANGYSHVTIRNKFRVFRAPAARQE